MLKNVASIQIQKVATFNSDRKIINLIPKNQSDITNNSHRLFFDAFVYSSYFITRNKIKSIQIYFNKN